MGTMADKTSKNVQGDPVFRAILGYHYEASQAKRSRMAQNKINWDVYHNRQDWSHKKKGQSKDFLPKQSQSTEQLTSFLQQGLMDIGEWFRVEKSRGVSEESLLFTPSEVQSLLKNQLDKNNFSAFIADQLKSSLLSSLLICKVGGRSTFTPSYQVKIEKPAMGIFGKAKRTLQKTETKRWQLDLSLVRAEDWYPDPTGDGLYEIEEVEMDYHTLLALAKKYPEEFDSAVIQEIRNNEDYDQSTKKSEETDQNEVHLGTRKRIRFMELWGTICHPETGEVLHENCVARYTKDGRAITKPKANPLWHQESPYVVSPILRVPKSMWHKAVMDSPTLLNLSLNELYNLQFDGAMMSVFGVKQLRENFLENPEEVSDGIAPGQTLKVTSELPINGKALERVDTGTLENEAMNMFQVADREFMAAAFTNDYRTGNMAQRQVKATEIVAANSAITGVFNGIVKTVEQSFMEKLLVKSWLTMAQHMNDLNSEEVKSILGEERANQVFLVSPEDRFAKTALGYTYSVFGLSQTLSKLQDFKKVATLLQTVGNSEILMREYMRKYSMTKLLGLILRNLDIDEDKLLPEQVEKDQRAQEAQMQQQMAMAMAAQGKGPGGKRTLEQGANTGSQVAPIANMPEDTGMEPGNPANDMGLTT